MSQIPNFGGLIEGPADVGGNEPFPSVDFLTRYGLSPVEAGYWQRNFPGLNPLDFNITPWDARRLLQADVAVAPGYGQNPLNLIGGATSNPRDQDIGNSLRGIQDFSPRALAAEGISEQGNIAMPVNLSQADFAVNNAKTYVPINMRMRHKRLGSGLHVAILSDRIILQFAAKKAAAEFCNSWNALISHIGQAKEFLPGDLGQAFMDIIIGGSGEFGLQAGFTPPLRGRVA